MIDILVIALFTIFNWFLIGIGFRLGSMVVEGARSEYAYYRMRQEFVAAKAKEDTGEVTRG